MPSVPRKDPQYRVTVVLSFELRRMTRLTGGWRDFFVCIPAALRMFEHAPRPLWASIKPAGGTVLQKACASFTSLQTHIY
jgi:hypothetical protein